MGKSELRVVERDAKDKKKAVRRTVLSVRKKEYGCHMTVAVLITESEKQEVKVKKEKW